MSLDKKLVVITNTYESLLIANSIENPIKDLAEIIKIGLEEKDLDELIKRLKEWSN